MKIVADYDVAPNPKPFQRPQGFICFNEPSKEEWLDKIIYDLDDDDSKFVRGLKRGTLTESEFELIIDRFEKEVGKEVGKEVENKETSKKKKKRTEASPCIGNAKDPS